MTTRVEERRCFVWQNQTHGALLCAPSYTPLALLILVPGSGPTTRDGIPVSEQIEGTHPPFAVWSNHLVAQRYAVVRYDKHRASTMSESLCFFAASRYCSGVRSGFGLSDSRDSGR